MKTVYNNIIPFKGFTTMTLWPFIFIRNECAWTFDNITERHEEIHGVQQREVLIIGIVLSVVLALAGCGWWSLLALPVFYWWYGLEWLVKFCYYRNRITAYKNISFEREAYSNQGNVVYLKQRKPYAFLKYLTKNN